MAFFDQIDPAELTGFAREMADQFLGESPLTPLFPDTQIDSMSYSWIVDEFINDVAEFRAFDAEATFGRSAVGLRKSGDLAALSMQLAFGEQEQLMLMSPGASMTVAQRVDDLAEQVARAIVNRVELLRGEALVTGKLAITDDENHVIQSADFGRAKTHTGLTPGALWSAPEADPITDLMKWSDRITQDSGREPDFLGMSRQAFRALAAALANSKYVTTQAGVVSANAANDVLAAYDLPTVTILDQMIEQRRVIGADQVVMAVRGMTGYTVWGTSVRAADTRFRLDGRRPGLVVGTLESQDGGRKYVLGDALVMPVLTNPSATLSAKVL